MANTALSALLVVMTVTAPLCAVGGIWVGQCG